MDVLLIAGSLTLPVYLGRQLSNVVVSHPTTFQPQATTTSSLEKKPFPRITSAVPRVPLALLVSTVLSFFLLSLSILEAVPSSWRMVLRAPLLPTAYRIVFGILAMAVFIIFPFVAGAQQQALLEQGWCRRNDSSSEDSSGLKKGRASHSWVRSCLFSMLLLLFRVLLGAFYCCYAVLPSLYRSHRKEKGPLLVTSSADLARKESNVSNTESTSNSSRSPRFQLHTRFLGGFLGCFLVLCILCVLGPWVVKTTPSTPTLTVAVSWLTAVGLLLSACINGFGSVSMPHSCLAGFYLEPIRPEAISKAQEEIQLAENSLQARKDQLSSLSGGGLVIPQATSNNIPRGMSFSEMGEDVVLRRKNLKTEIEFLETLVAEMKDEAEDMQQMQALAANARTPLGRCKLWLGLIFSLVLIVRLFSALLFLWNHKDGKHHQKTTGSDPITMILLWLVGHDYVTQQDYNTLSQFISCVLTAILSVSQLRTFLRTMDLVNRKLRHFYQHVPCCLSNGSGSCASTSSSSSGHVSSLYENFLACLMVCYFLSCIVLTKLMLPPDYRAAFSHALGGAETDSVLKIRSYSLNLTFTLSATVTTFILGIFLGIQRQNTIRHLSVWKSANTMDHSTTITEP